MKFSLLPLTIQWTSFAGAAMQDAVESFVECRDSVQVEQFLKLAAEHLGVG